MPAVNIRLRWPDGQESNIYSPSTAIYEHLEAGRRYPLTEFLRRAEMGLNAASERVKQVKGFYCSSAMDSLGGLQQMAKGFEDQNTWIEVLELKNHCAANMSYSAFGDI